MSIKNKLRILLFISIFSISAKSVEVNGYNVTGEVYIGTDIMFGVDNINVPTGYLSQIFKIALPRKNDFKEMVTPYPDFSKPNTGGDSGNTTTSTEEKEEELNAGIDLFPTVKNKYMNRDLNSVARILGNKIQFDTTLLDAKVNVKEIGLDLGLVMKSRPRKAYQKGNLFDLNRIYLTMGVDLDGIKLDGTYYIKGYENGTPGLNRYSENGYRDKKENGQLDLKGSLNALTKENVYVRPVLNFDYQGIAGVKTIYLDINPTFEFDVIDDDVNNLVFSLGYKYVENGRDIPTAYTMLRTGHKMAPGNKKVEYFKNWELAKDKVRDHKLGVVSGLNGSIRAVDSPTGALYGEEFLPMVMKMGAVEAITQIKDGNVIIDLLEGDNLGNFLNLFGGQITNFANDITDVTKNPKRQKEIVGRVALKILDKIGMGYDEDNYSDFHPLNYLPTQFSGLIDGLPAVVYSDSKANNGKKEKEIDFSKFYKKDEKPAPTAGGPQPDTPEAPAEMIVDWDFQNAIFNTEFKEIIALAKKFATQSTAESIGTGIAAVFKAEEYIKPIRQLLLAPEELEAMDMFRPILFAESEAFANNKVYLAKYNPALKYTYLGNRGELQEIKNETKNQHGFNMGVKYKYEDKLKTALLFEYVNGEYNKEYSSPEYNSNLKMIPEYTIIENKKKISADYTAKYLNKIDIVENSKKNNYKLNGILKYNDNDVDLDVSFKMNADHIKYKNLTTQKLYSKKYDRLNNLYPIIPNLDNKTGEPDNIYQTYLEADYTNYDFKFNTKLMYVYKPHKRVDIEMGFEYENVFKYVDYNKISGYVHDIKENPEIPEMEEIMINVFKRKDGKLIKKENAKVTDNAEFDGIQAGEAVDINKFSRYLFTDLTDYFETEKSKGQDNLYEITTDIVPTIGLKYKPIDNLQFSSKFKMPVQFVDKNLKGILLKTELGISVIF